MIRGDKKFASKKSSKFISDSLSERPTHLAKFNSRERRYEKNVPRASPVAKESRRSGINYCFCANRNARIRARGRRRRTGSEGHRDATPSASRSPARSIYEISSILSRTLVVSNVHLYRDARRPRENDDRQVPEKIGGTY